MAGEAKSKKSKKCKKCKKCKKSKKQMVALGLENSQQHFHRDSKGRQRERERERERERKVGWGICGHAAQCQIPL